MNWLPSAFFLLLSLIPLGAAGPARPALREPDRVIHPWQEGDWKGQLPGGWKIGGPEQSEVTPHMGGTLTIKNVSDPILAYFAPPPGTGSPAKGLIVCPGGGYNILAWDLDKDEKSPGLVPGPGSPPAFLSHSADDGLTYHHSNGYFNTLQSHKIPAELHLWPDGGHGYGMRSPLAPKAWPTLLAAWLASLKASPPSNAGPC